MLSAFLVAALFGRYSVPQLSHQSVTQLVQHYLETFPPEVPLLDGGHSRTQLDDALVASGLFFASSGPGSCGEPLTYLGLTALGHEVVSPKGWILHNGWLFQVGLTPSLRRYRLLVPLAPFRW